MARRPRQHLLESESRQAFDSILPLEWVTNRPQNDYGIDLEVQIFENGASTPYFFYVQLKGTDKKIDEKKGLSYLFSIEKLLEYEQYPLPVLLVVYFANDKSLFYRWTHDLLAELEVSGTNAETKKKLTVQFEAQLTRHNSEVVLSESVREYFFLRGLQAENAEVVKVNLRLNIGEASEVETQLKQWFWSDKALDFIKIGNYENADLYVDGIKEWGAITVTSRSKTLAYPFLEAENENDIPKLILSSLKMALADALAQTGRRNTALSIITRFILEAGPINSTAYFIFSQPSWAVQYALSGRTLEALEIASNLVNSEHPHFGNFLAFSSQFRSTSSLVTRKYRDFCTKAVQSAKDDRQKGIQSYNLANALGSEDSFRQAVINYCRAAKYAPEYLVKSYWWAEIGGCFFLMDKYRWAERCYRRSVELGEERIPSRYLLADCLLYQGRFDEAIKELNTYLDETERPCARAILQKWLAEFLLARFGNSKRNISKSNEHIEEALNKENIEQRRDTFLQAIQFDPLSGLAWHNFRVSEDQTSYPKNINTWLASIITNPNDNRSWAYFVVFMFLEFPEIEWLKHLQLAVISEAWNDKVRIEDEIRNILPKNLVATFFQGVEPLIKEAKATFFNTRANLIRQF